MPKSDSLDLISFSSFQVMHFFMFKINNLRFLKCVIQYYAEIKLWGTKSYILMYSFHDLRKEVMSIFFTELRGNP